MLHVLLAAPLLAPAVTAGAGSRIVARGDGIIRAPVRAIPDAAPHLRARQNQVDVLNQDNGTLYAIEVQIGTPAQTQMLIVDSGSPNTWVNPTCSLSNSPRSCEALRQFDTSSSDSFRDLDVSDILRYGIGNATVNWATETLAIGSATIENQIVGIAVESHKIPMGILGISPPVGGTNDYPYVLDTMVAQGLIKSRAFSLDLRGVENPNGALIFGGIDTRKFIGELVRLPMLSPRQSPLGANRYYVRMTGIGLTFPDGSTLQSEELSIPVFLDSGATLSQLPERITEAIVASFPEAEYNPLSGLYFLPCYLVGIEGSIDFYFAGKTIRVPLNEFIWQTGEFCVLGVKASDDDENVLGDTFLRAAYVVYDQDNRALWIAQAGNCGEELVAIGSGEDAVPTLTGHCTELPTPTGTGSRLDVSRTRVPTNTFTGAATINPLGPGPAGSRTGSALQPSQSDNAAGKGVEVRFGAVVGFAVVNLLAWVL